MRQLELFGLETEPQSFVMEQPENAAELPHAATPLVFSDHRIGVKLKFKPENKSVLIADVQPAAQAPAPSLPVFKEEEIVPPVAVATAATNEEPFIPRFIDVELPFSAIGSMPEASATPQESTVASVVATEEAITEPPITAAQLEMEEVHMVHRPLTRPSVITIEEEAEILPVAEEIIEVAPSPEEPVEAAAPSGEITAEVELSETIAATTELAEEVQPASDEVLPVVQEVYSLHRPFLARPAVITIEEEEEEAPIATAREMIEAEEVIEEAVATEEVVIIEIEITPEILTEAQFSEAVHQLSIPGVESIDEIEVEELEIEQHTVTEIEETERPEESEAEGVTSGEYEEVETQEGDVFIAVDKEEEKAEAAITEDEIGEPFVVVQELAVAADAYTEVKEEMDGSEEGAEKLEEESEEWEAYKEAEEQPQDAFIAEVVAEEETEVIIAEEDGGDEFTAAVQESAVAADEYFEVSEEVEESEEEWEAEGEEEEEYEESEKYEETEEQIEEVYAGYEEVREPEAALEETEDDSDGLGEEVYADDEAQEQYLNATASAPIPEEETEGLVAAPEEVVEQEVIVVIQESALAEENTPIEDITADMAVEETASEEVKDEAGDYEEEKMQAEEVAAAEMAMEAIEAEESLEEAATEDENALVAEKGTITTVQSAEEKGEAYIEKENEQAADEILIEEELVEYVEEEEAEVAETYTDAAVEEAEEEAEEWEEEVIEGEEETEEYEVGEEPEEAFTADVVEEIVEEEEVFAQEQDMFAVAAQAAMEEEEFEIADEIIAPLDKNGIGSAGRAERTSRREVIAKQKRGRKSLREIDAEVDLIQIPDDEILFEKQYYPISVVAGWFNVNPSLLRFWENEFDILKPRKNRKGDRLFRPEDVKNLQVIYYLLRQRKFTIEGAREYLKTNKKKADTQTQLVQSLNKVRNFLLEFKASLLL